jgi:transposase
MKKIYHVGIDVDDKNFHGYIFEEKMEFTSRPTARALIKKLEEILGSKEGVRICYEASYLGYSLQRDLSQKGYECEIIAPSSIPKSPGEQVKTDRIDCKRLAEYYEKGMLKTVRVPDKEQEALRDLLRARQFVQKQLKGARQYLLGQCRRIGLDYRQAKPAKTRKSHWTQEHRQWLGDQIKAVRIATLKATLELLMSQIESLERQVGFYEQKIEEMASHPRYEKSVKALSCYRGIGLIGALTLVTEIGDIQRFDHPKRLTSYAGMDMREYSSGGKQRQWSMTKMGNRWIRTTVIEASQKATLRPKESYLLKKRREGVARKYIEIADRCMDRLAKKGQRLLYAGKERNKVKVACARELLCFVWESLRLAV